MDTKIANWTVEGLIQEGLIALGGRKFVGKSWLALQIAGAVASGSSIFDIQTTKSSVLYLALEDSPRRLADRYKKMRIPPLKNIVFRTQWQKFTDGGLDTLLETIASKIFILRLNLVIELLQLCNGSNRFYAFVAGKHHNRNCVFC